MSPKSPLTTLERWATPPTTSKPPETPLQALENPTSIPTASAGQSGEDGESLPTHRKVKSSHDAPSPTTMQLLPTSARSVPTKDIPPTRPAMLRAHRATPARRAVRTPSRLPDPFRNARASLTRQDPRASWSAWTGSLTNEGRATGFPTSSAGIKIGRRTKTFRMKMNQAFRHDDAAAAMRAPLLHTPARPFTSTRSRRPSPPPRAGGSHG